MTTRPSSRYPDLQAPDQDADLVLWPQPAQLINSARDNHRRLNAESPARIQGIPLHELRRTQQTYLNLPPDTLILGAGHQAELFHAGVWAKLALLNAAAGKTGAQTLHLAVDTDTPKHLHVRWPGFSEPVTDDEELNRVAWTDALDGPTPAHVAELKSKLTAAAADFSFVPMLGGFFDDLARQAIEQPGLARTITQAMHRVDWELGLRHQAMLLSPMLNSQTYLILVYHILSRAGEFAQVYNMSLREFRKANRIRKPGQPMPELAVGESIETPFWRDDLSKRSRSRAVVVADGNNWRIEIAGDSLLLNPAADAAAAAADLQKFLRRHDARLAPRAVTLMFFARLLIVDQFVHGIGGARYDQVTDRIIERFFGIEPPSFAITTATLYFPTVAGRSAANWPKLRHEGHRLRHQAMGERKLEMVRTIQNLPRYSPQRHQIFSQMHENLASLEDKDPALAAWRLRRADAQQQEATDKPLFDREFFYLLQPRERLAMLADQFRALFGGSAG